MTTHVANLKGTTPYNWSHQRFFERRAGPQGLKPVRIVVHRTPSGFASQDSGVSPRPTVPGPDPAPVAGRRRFSFLLRHPRSVPLLRVFGGGRSTGRPH